MQQINQYQVVQKKNQLTQDIQLWLCENSEGESFEVLTIAKNERYDKLLERLISNEVKSLLNREISGFQKVLETGFDIENKVTFIVYENFEGKELTYENANMLSLKAIAKGLDVLKKENRQNYVISPEYISVDRNGSAKVKFIGLFELFKSENLLNYEYLAPNVVEWINEMIQKSQDLTSKMIFFHWLSLLKAFL